MFPIIDIDNPRTIVKAFSERAFEYHMLTPTVMKCAEKGDKVCMEIIDRASFHLMELLEALRPNFKLKSIPVACMGGIIDANTLLAKKIEERIKKNKAFKWSKPNGSALDGALTMAQDFIESMD
jgi:N-acetylglucosamine kinase-like BadF-type ATPase